MKLQGVWKDKLIKALAVGKEDMKILGVWEKVLEVNKENVIIKFSWRLVIKF